MKPRSLRTEKGRRKAMNVRIRLGKTFGNLMVGVAEARSRLDESGHNIRLGLAK